MNSLDDTAALVASGKQGTSTTSFRTDAIFQAGRINASQWSPAEIDPDYQYGRHFQTGPTSAFKSLFPWKAKKSP